MSGLRGSSRRNRSFASLKMTGSVAGGQRREILRSAQDDNGKAQDDRRGRPKMTMVVTDGVDKMRQAKPLQESF